MEVTAGIDIGSSAVKCVVVRSGEKENHILSRRVDRIRRRDLKSVLEENFAEAVKASGIPRKDLQYVATTGEGEIAEFRTGHFYSMTAHARGALYLEPKARGAIDLGALHTRAIKMDPRGKVLQYQMTSQCASGSGQFLENIARYLGVSLEEVGDISLQADKPETVSSICAVLSETDVINMVSRGISTANILCGIHLSISSRLVRLLRAIKVEETVLLTGGLSQDEGLLSTLQNEMNLTGAKVRILSHPDSVYAGAIGAAIWGAYRSRKLKEQGGTH